MVFERQIASATRLIKKYGQVCDWHKDELTPIDAAKPWLGSTNVPTVKNPVICFLPPSGQTFGSFGLYKYRAQVESGEITQFGLMAVQDFVPELSDVVYRDGVALVITQIDKLAPNSETIMYMLALK